jgi:arylformamidase
MEYVYEKLSQADLDREYNNRASVPNFNDRMNAWAAHESIVKQNIQCLENIPYGKLSEEKLDLYPSNQPKSPVLVYLHGGDFTKLEKGHMAFPAPSFVQAGISYISADFPMRPSYTITQIRDSIRKLIQWVWANASKYNFDPDQIYIGGGSSGSNLCCQMLMMDWEEYNLPQSIIKGAVLLGPLADWMPVKLSYRQRYLQLTDDEIEFMSVVRYKGKFVDCPMIVINGSDELDEYQRQGKWLADEWTKRGNDATLMLLPAHEHFSIVETWAKYDSEPFQKTLKMIKHSSGETK